MSGCTLGTGQADSTLIVEGNLVPSERGSCNKESNQCLGAHWVQGRIVAHC